LEPSLTDQLTRPAHELYQPSEGARDDDPIDYGGLNPDYQPPEGVPLTPAPAIPGTEPIIGNKIGVQGNPPGIDDLFNSPWCFIQENDWEAWFNIVADPNGGYFVTNPVTRWRHHAAMYGGDTHADLDHNFQLSFVVNWADGSKGRYQGGIGHDANVFEGTATDQLHPGINSNFRGHKVRRSDFPVPPGTPPLKSQPMIHVQAFHNNNDNGYNVTVGGSGFGSEEAFELQGKYIKNGVEADWSMYAQGTTDILGRFGATFSVTKPLGATYKFRARSTSTGFSMEMAI
jgi:hypothetical protein